MEQLARNLTDAGDGFLTDKRSLILDRDPLYTRDFRRLLRDSGALPEPVERESSAGGPVACRERLGRMLKSYDRAAA